MSTEKRITLLRLSPTLAGEIEMLTVKGQGTAATPIVSPKTPTPIFSPKTPELREAGFNREKAEKDLPLYMARLVAGYEYRTYWYELFECFRKVPVLGIASGSKSKISKPQKNGLHPAKTSSWRFP